MIPPSFEYLRPNTIPEAVKLLQQHGDEAKILSGGQSLIPMMKLRLARPSYLVDINRIEGLSHIKEESGFLKIGGLTREAELEASPVVRAKYPIIIDTAHVIADPQVRNLATVGGNLAHGDPANDHPATMIALGAQVVASGPKGERTIPIENFFVSLFTTTLQPDEILTEIRIPIPPPRSGGAYFKLERKVGDYATAAAAAQLTLGAGGAVERCGMALTNVGPTPVHATAAAQGIVGKKPDDKAIAEAARAAAAATSPNADRRGNEEYKREMSRVLMTRALRKAVERAGGH